MVQAIFTDGVDVVTAHGLTQWDYGQTLEIRGLTLPASFQVHFACKRAKEAIVRLGTTNSGVGRVVIPDTMLEQDTDLRAWIYIVGEGTGETIKLVQLPIETRLKPQDWIDPVDPSQQTMIEEFIAEINELMDTMSGEVDQISGEVDAISEDVDTIKDNVETISDNVDTLGANVDTLGANVTTMSGEVDQISGEVDAIDNEVDQLNTKVNAKVNKSGDTMTGALTAPAMYAKNDWGAFTTKDSSGNNRVAYQSSNTGRAVINQYDTANSGYADRYMFPTAPNNLDADVWYNVLTSKNPVTVAQGGTGATTAAAARTALGITPANIGAATSGHTHTASQVGAVAKSGDTMTGTLLVPMLRVRASSGDDMSINGLETGTENRIFSILGNSSTHAVKVAVFDKTNKSVADDYFFPAATNGQTTGKDYEILTTKNPETVQGLSLHSRFSADTGYTVNTDLNTILAIGIYHFEGQFSTAKHFPFDSSDSTGRGELIVLGAKISNTNGYYAQIFISHKTSRMYIRNYSWDGWLNSGNWTQIGNN